MSDGAVALYDIFGDPMAVEVDTAIPTGTAILIGGGSDGTNARYILVDSSGRQILVGAGIPGTPTGGVITIQGVIGGIDVPVSVSGTATVSGTVTANIGTTGGLALDSTLAKLTISQSTALGSNTQVLIGGSVTTAAPTYTNGNVNPFSLTTAGALRIDGSATIQPVSGTITANQGGTWNITNISGTISLPTGAATESTLSAISGKLPAALVGGRLDTNIGAWLGSTSPTVGQKAMSSSIPVAIASDQSSIPVHISASIPAGNNNIGDVDIANFGVVVSTNNSTTTPLGAGAEFTGTAESVTPYQEIDINLAGSPTNAPGTLYFEFSPDGTNWDVSIPIALTGPTMVPQFLRVVLPWFRVRYVNGATVQTTFRLTVVYHRTGAARLTRFLNQTIDNTEPVENVRAVIAGAEFNNNSNFTNKILDEHAVDLDNRSLTPLTNGSTTAFTADAGTDTLTSNSHGLQDGDAVNLTTTGTLPAPFTTTTTSSTGIINETIYWVIGATTNTFQLSTSPTGSAVNITDTGTGTHSFQKRGQFIGVFKNVSQVGSILSFFFSNSKPGVLRLEWSSNGTSQNTDLLSSTSISTEPFVTTIGTFHLGLNVSNTIVSSYYRVRIVNGPTDQNATSGFYAFIGKNPAIGTVATLNAPLSLLSISQLVRSVTAGVTPDGYFKNAKIQGAHTDNSSITLLPGNSGGTDHIFTGKWFNWQEDYVGLIIDLSSDVSGTLKIEFAEADTPTDGVDTDVLDTTAIAYDPVTLPLLRRHITVQSKWVRVKYINGAAAQTKFTLDTSFVTGSALEPKIPINKIPDARTLANMAQSIVLAERGEVSDEFVKVKTTRNSSSKDGLNVNITGIEDDSVLKPLEAGQVRQFTVGASAVQIDTPTLSTPGKRRVLGIQTKGLNWIGYGFSNSITFTGNAMLLPPNSFKSIALDEGVNIWAITEQTGGTQTTQNLNGSSASGTATSPSNALTSNDTRASITAVGQTIRVTGITYTPTASSSIQSVRIGCEARKQPGQAATVSHVATVTQASTEGAGNAGSITSSTITGGSTRLILVAISRENENSAVTMITNTGTALTWTKLQDVTAGSTRRLDVWWARGNPGATFTVTASFSQTATNCHIAVSTYDNSDTNPISSSGTNTGTGTAVTGPSLTGADKKLSYLAVIQGNTTATAGSGYTERSDERTTTGSEADRDGLSTHTKALTTGGSEQGTATLSASTTWGAIGIIINNAPATDPIVTLSYETPDGTPGATSNNIIFTSESDSSQFSDITGDRSWAESNIDNIVLIATGQTIGTAALEVDRLWIEVVDTTGNTVRVSVEQYAGTS